MIAVCALHACGQCARMCAVLALCALSAFLSWCRFGAAEYSLVGYIWIMGTCVWLVRVKEGTGFGDKAECSPR